MNLPKFPLVFSLAVILSINFTASASELVASPSLSILKSAKLAELPGKAAELVAAADAKSQGVTTTDVVKAAIGLNPAAAATIVGSISATTPEMAAVAAGTAAGLLPKQAPAIAQAAVAAAPKQICEIIQAVCRVAPDSYRKITVAIEEIAPKESREILTCLAAALPQLNEGITNALATCGDKAPSVEVILARVDSSTVSLLAAGTPASVTPRVHPVPGPGYIPQPTTPVILDPGQNSAVPTGGRNYANPVPVGGDYSP
jgi:hypothetical protein